jgi:hypothetical protein
MDAKKNTVGTTMTATGSMIVTTGIITNWNDNEDHSYRLYLGERHREYRPFAEMKEKEQRAYWKWRHRHPDHDHDGR